ncbi:hypothetical protein QZH41_013484, partial [Actinostola sp. cb2023]
LHVRPGESLLVHGASGGVGIAAVQFARSHGMVVFGTAGTDDGEAVIRKAGAHYTFNHRSLNYLDKIKDATGGSGIDVIVEMLANANLHKDLQLLATGGRIASHDRYLLLMAQCFTVQPRLSNVMNILEKLNNRRNNRSRPPGLDGKEAKHNAVYYRITDTTHIAKVPIKRLVSHTNTKMELTVYLGQKNKEYADESN